jgi:hypothetical protein
MSVSDQKPLAVSVSVLQAWAKLLAWSMLAGMKMSWSFHQIELFKLIVIIVIRNNTVSF